MGSNFHQSFFRAEETAQHGRALGGRGKLLNDRRTPHLTNLTVTDQFSLHRRCNFSPVQQLCWASDFTLNRTEVQVLCCPNSFFLGVEKGERGEGDLASGGRDLRSQFVENDRT